MFGVPSSTLTDKLRKSMEGDGLLQKPPSLKTFGQSDTPDTCIKEEGDARSPTATFRGRHMPIQLFANKVGLRIT